jgi:hypothetical protein
MVQQIPSGLIGNAFEKWELVIKESFDLKELYTRLQKFLEEEDWKDMHTGGDNYEVRFHKITDDRGSDTYQIWWRAQKEVDVGNGYYKYYLKLDFMPKFMAKDEQMINGKKVALDKGELNIKCWLYLHQNASGDEAWKSNWFLRLFKNHFWNATNAQVKGKVMGDLTNFNQDLYKFFQVNTGVVDSDGPKDFFMHPKGLDQR